MSTGSAVRPLVLVVEDERKQRDLFRRFLENDGCSVMEASGGDDFLRVLQNNLPQVIVLDIALSGELQGWDLFNMLKNDPKTSQIPVLFMTGTFITQEDKMKSLGLGAADYLRKPIDLHELSAKVKYHAISKRGVAADAIYPPVKDAAASSGSADFKGLILAIEDDSGQKALISEILLTAGFRVLCASDGKEGIKLAQKLKPDAILLDIMLPGMNGVKVHSALKANENTRDIPVVMMTAMEDSAEAMADAVRDLGVNIFLRKPFKAKDLRECIEGALSPQKRRSRCLSLGRIRVDLDTRQVWVSGVEKSLGPKIFDLLCILIRHPEGITKDELLKEGWMHGTDTNTLVKSIQRLREDLGSEKDEFIVSIPKGYKLLG